MERNFKMEKEINNLFDEAILLELSVSDLYSLFSQLFPEDALFWRQIVMEEKSHAAIIRSGKDFYSVGMFPGNLLPESIQVLTESCNKIRRYMKTIRNNPVRTEAFKIALEIENSAGEIHYNNFMLADDSSGIAVLFKKLNGFDIDHIEKINKYIEGNGIVF